MSEWNLQVYSINNKEVVYKYYFYYNCKYSLEIRNNYIETVNNDYHKRFYKKNDYYYLSDEYFVTNWDKIQPDYIIDNINYFKDKYVYINVNTGRHEDTFEDIRNILLYINNYNIKNINLIDKQEEEIINQHMISINYEDLDYFSEELKNLIQMTGYHLKFGYVFIKIIPEVVKYIKIDIIEESESEDDYSSYDEIKIKEVHFNTTINIKSLNKSELYYNLLIAYCLLILNKYSFIDWMLKYMNGANLFNYNDKYEYFHEDCHLIK